MALKWRSCQCGVKVRGLGCGVLNTDGPDHENPSIGKGGATDMSYSTVLSTHMTAATPASVVPLRAVEATVAPVAPLVLVA